ncbi:response regulator [Eubacterium sp. MSJ-21]|nr:response regulator [Eubacterium sp. MSJ-21]
MKILAADDEELGYRQLVTAIQEAAPDAEIKAFQEPDALLHFAKEHPCDVAFLDVEMGHLSGVEVARQLKQWYPKVNIIFVTGYSQYMEDAIRLRTSGYVGKPVTKEKIQEELENLRHPVEEIKRDVLVVRCFGTFDVFMNGKSLNFERSKTKEMLAYLIDRRGSAVTSGELRAVLWEDAETDEKTGVYLQKLKRDLINTLKSVGMESVFVTGWNKYAIDPSRISCDYYDYLDGRPEGVRAYNGEYMAQYDWRNIEDIN